MRLESLGSELQISMRRISRDIFLATLLAVYGVGTLGGPALHAIPGAGHSLPRNASEKADSSGLPGHQKTSHHDCPICSFGSQGQLSVGLGLALFVDVVPNRESRKLPLFFPPPLARPASPRAPPVSLI
jgi:hypothetical protein